MSTRTQTAVRNKKPYYVKAFAEDLRAIWSHTPFNSEEEILSMCYYAAITAFCAKADADTEHHRRELLYWYLAGESDPDSADSYINKKYSTLPISDNLFKKISRNVLSAYSEPPVRKFSATDSIDKTFIDLYNDSGANSALKSGYKIAGFTNIVAMRPKRVLKHSLGAYVTEHEILTPDLFRCRFSEDDIHDVVEMWVPYQAGAEMRFRVWTADKMTVKDAKGYTISEEENRYKRIPYEFFRFETGKDFYGPGEISLVQAQLYNNKLLAHGDESETYSALSFWLATNLDVDGNNFKLAPGSMLNFKDVRESANGMEAQPGLEPVNGTPFFTEINDYRKELAKDELRTFGLPEDTITEGGTPLSGIAKIISQQELTEERNERVEKLRANERRYAELFARVLNTDMAKSLPDVLPDFQIDFAEPRYFLELKDDYEFDILKLERGLISPAGFVKKWIGVDADLTDDAAVEMMLNNKNLFKKLDTGATPAPQNSLNQKVEENA